MMKNQLKREAKPLPAIALLDGAIHVVAVNSEWHKLVPTAATAEPGISLTEIASAVPGLAEWAANAVEIEGEFSSADTRLIAQKLPLPAFADASQPLILLTVWPASVGETSKNLRHDLKNRISGLKLYATFLKRKLNAQPELLDVVNKMLGALDQMNSEVGKI